MDTSQGMLLDKERVLLTTNIYQDGAWLRVLDTSLTQKGIMPKQQKVSSGSQADRQPMPRMSRNGCGRWARILGLANNTLSLIPTRYTARGPATTTTRPTSRSREVTGSHACHRRSGYGSTEHAWQVSGARLPPHTPWTLMCTSPWSRRSWLAWCHSAQLSTSTFSVAQTR